jgi:hopanoid-associated phosphorylase
MRIGVVTGLRAEAAVLRRDDAIVAISGGDPAESLAHAEALLRQGIAGLMSFGLAGGLAPGLAPGTLVLATGIMGRDRVRATDAAWRARMAANLPGAVPGLILAGEYVIAGATDKGRHYRETAALAVDMESGAVALAAERANVPFMAMRAIADPAERSLPPAALVGLTASGGYAIGAVLLSILREPRQIPALIGLARDARRGLDALLRGSARLGPGLDLI